MKEHHYDFGKLIEKIRRKLEHKIDQDNEKICRFFEDSFGKSPGEIDPEKIKNTYFFTNPVITRENGKKCEGWDEVKSCLGEEEPGTECSPGDVEIEIDYIEDANPEGKVKDDFDLQAHVKTAFICGGKKASAESDPDGEGDLRHRRICVWEP